MSELIAISEGSEEFKIIQEAWRAKASEATLETLPALLEEMTGRYSHDYGTICHAIAIAAKAAACAVDHSPQGGITGFQAGCIMWQFIREWNHSSNKTGMKLIDYDNFLYPQYADKFQKTMTKDVFANLQKAAGENMSKADDDYQKYLVNLEKYKGDIQAFVEKYPDYHERKEHYDPLGVATSAEWDAEKKKKDSGFEFAPQAPYEPVNKSSKVYRHWEAIVGGVVPFGYRVAED